MSFMKKLIILQKLRISEFIYVLERQKQTVRNDIVKFVSFFLDGDMFVMNARIADILPFYLVHPKLSFNDCYLAAKATENNAEPLWTLDQKLARQSKSARLFK